MNKITVIISYKLMHKDKSMFKNIDDIKKIIEEEDIINIDVRNISDDGVKCVTFCSRFVINNLDFFFMKGYRSRELILGNLDLSSAFMEVFLAHKTLVFFADDMHHSNDQSYEKENKYNFAIIDNITPYWATPEQDNYRDFVGEVVSSLKDMGEKIRYFYADKDNMYSIILDSESKYSLEKVKYAILMVAKAYNININETKGVFIE